MIFTASQSMIAFSLAGKYLLKYKKNILLPHTSDKMEPEVTPEGTQATAANTQPSLSRKEICLQQFLNFTVDENIMGEEEQATLDGQFVDFAKFMEPKTRDGSTITLYRLDYWLRQAKVLDDRRVTMTDTGICFNKYCKTEINFDEFLEILQDLAEYKQLDLEKLHETLTNCGLPGQSPVEIPNYRDYFKTFKPKNTKYCNATFDGYLCWPPTAAGLTASQKCPSERLSDTNKDAYRVCGEHGLWLGRKPNESSVLGWTNFTACFPTDVWSLLAKVYDDDDKDAQAKFNVAERTRMMEHIGFSTSLVALVLSLFIFTYYRSLRNNRTRIHKNLFTAMTVQVIIRLTLYVDQAIARSRIADGTGDQHWSIENMPYVCEGSYALLEYAITVMFMWMFIEGLYLHNVVTGNSLRERRFHKMYYIVGWGLPVLLTGLWSVLTHLHYRSEHAISCWYGYNFTAFYWILQGPRLAVILINLVFLLNIMRALIIKLRRSESNELDRVRKAVRAALILLPLLGITYILNMIEPPLNPVWSFALWSYTSHFLRSFQGFFIAVIYCFLNGEVRMVVRKQYDDYIAIRGTARPQGSDQSERNQPRCGKILCCSWCSPSPPPPEDIEMQETRNPTPYHVPHHHVEMATISFDAEAQRLPQLTRIRGIPVAPAPDIFEYVMERIDREVDLDPEAGEER